MIIPEDGCLPTLTTSNLNSFNNIMILKVDDNCKKPGETSYQLATLDRSKKGTIWPADKYLEKLIPDLPKIKSCDDYNKEFEAKKELNLSIHKPITNITKLCHKQEQNRHRPRRSRPSFTKKKNWSPGLENNANGFLNSSDINPWIQYPWDNQSLAPPDGARSMSIPLILDGPNFSERTNDGFHGFGPPGITVEGHHILQNVLPPSNGYLDYSRDRASNVNSYTNNFNKSSITEVPKHSYENYKQNPRKRNNESNYRHGGKPETRYSLPPVKRLEVERDDSASNLRYNSGYSRNNSFGEVSQDVSMNIPHTNYVPIPRHGHTPFEDNYREPILETPSAYKNNVGNRRNNLNDASYQGNHFNDDPMTPNFESGYGEPEMNVPRPYNNNIGNRRNNNSNNQAQFPHIQNGKQWKNSAKFTHHLNPRGNGNSRKRYRNKNQRNLSMTNKKKNFKGTAYEHRF